MGSIDVGKDFGDKRLRAFTHINIIYLIYFYVGIDLSQIQILGMTTKNIEYIQRAEYVMFLLYSISAYRCWLLYKEEHQIEIVKVKNKLIQEICNTSIKKKYKKYMANANQSFNYKVQKVIVSAKSPKENIQSLKKYFGSRSESISEYKDPIHDIKLSIDHYSFPYMLSISYKVNYINNFEPLLPNPAYKHKVDTSNNMWNPEITEHVMLNHFKTSMVWFKSDLLMLKKSTKYFDYLIAMTLTILNIHVYIFSITAFKSWSLISLNTIITILLIVTYLLLRKIYYKSEFAKYRSSSFEKI
jgi:hypothetical protein